MQKPKLILPILCFAIIFAGILYSLYPDAELNKDVQNHSQSKLTIPIQTVTNNSSSTESDIEVEVTQSTQVIPTQVNELSGENDESQVTDDLYAKEVALRDVLYKIMEEYPNITIDKVNCEIKECTLKYTSYDQSSKAVTNQVLKEYIDTYGENVQLKNVLENNGKTLVEIVIKN
ncbi:hypothetical protein [Kangiella koreensis]|uniref:Uncharacterized protein n=1 Tax=Kangiella koreensis (strain DSM 16069 / JCM 12317 / KCTC 12182 / SW-125) TaxID=523791 RepID=C7R5W4_KANKD|nr:hypothetical protein [Kangiella koreensis]ACV27288.1 hypothetical protein Kkor_1876 [Kangiella koreensis DSM 16069]